MTEVAESPQFQSFADVTAPEMPERFFAENDDRAPVYVPGEVDRFGATVAWETLNRLLGMDCWTQQTL